MAPLPFLTRPKPLITTILDLSRLLCLRPVHLSTNGNTLRCTVTEKHTTVVVRGKRYWVGLSDMQGWRISTFLSHSHTS
jgi:hypothetical protein